MKLLIQLTFNNGLGNLYCGVIEILHFVEKYKKLGYSAELIFAINGSACGNKFIDFCNFEDIFDVDDFKMFDRIRTFQNSIGIKEFEGYTYHSTQYGPDYPGAHWWDVYFDTIPDKVFPKDAYNVETLLSKQHVPSFIPKFNKKVYHKVKKFRKKNKNIETAIQVRYFDSSTNPDQSFLDFVENLFYGVEKSKKKLHVSSNNPHLLTKLSILKNVVEYEFSGLDKLTNDHNYYLHFKNFENEFLYDRLLDNIAEMVILSHYDKIYYKTFFSWNSTFLYFALCNNQNLKLININDNTNIE